jgi:hypothetical protein
MYFVLQVAQVLALAFAGLALLVGVGKCLESAERRGANEQCFYGLAALLFDLLLVMGAVLGVRLLAQPVSMAVIATTFFLASALVVLAWGLSAVGTVQCLVDHQQGMLAGISTLVLCTVAGGGLAWLAWDVTRDGVPTAMVLYGSATVADSPALEPNDLDSEALLDEESETVADAAPSTPPMEHAKAEAVLKDWSDWLRAIPWLNQEPGYVYLRDHNLRFRIPTPKWGQVKPLAQFKELLALQHSDLPVRFNFRVIEVGPEFRLGSASLIGYVQANYKEPVRDAIVLADRTVIIHGMRGRRIDFSYRVNGRSYNESCWHAAAGGYLNRMAVTADGQYHSAALAAATELFAGLSPIRREPKAHIAGPTDKPARAEGIAGRRS